MKSLFLVAAILLLCLSQSAQADNSGPYLGGGFSATGIMNSSCANAGFFSSCAGNSPSNGPTSGTPFGLVGGYDFNKHFGLEIGLAQLGTYTVQGASGMVVGDFKASATTLAMKVGGTSASGLSVFGKFGLASVNTKYTALPGWAFAGSANQRTTGYLAGIGMQYNVNDIVGFRVSLDIINYSDAVFSVFMRNVSMMAVFKL